MKNIFGKIKNKIFSSITVLALVSTVFFTGCEGIDISFDGDTAIINDMSGAGNEAGTNKMTDIGEDENDSNVTNGQQEVNEVTYRFRNKKLLEQHFDKHGKDMGFSNAKEYEKAASSVINNPDALTKTEKEDGDYVFYVEKTNEFVILSTDGYIRTYFLPDSGKKYYDKQ